VVQIAADALSLRSLAARVAEAGTTA
jgi:hypothetical protein